MNNKLIVCASCLQSGGAERVLSVLSSSFADNFDEVEYVLWLDWRFPGRFYTLDKRVKVIGLGSVTGTKNVIKHMLWFRKHVKNYNPSAILSFFEMINMCVIFSLIGINSRIVVSERNDPCFFQHNLILRKLINLSYHFKCVQNIVMQTQHNKNYFSNSKLINKTCVIYNPILLKTDIIGSWLKSPKRNVIISAARLEPQKRHDIMIKAFYEFRKTHADYNLIIYGNGSRLNELKSLLNKLELSDCVFFPGTTTELWHEMQSAKFFMMTSEYEGMSNSLIEAMSIGLPCISTEVSGATELIDTGKNGFLVNIHDIDKMVKYMNILASDSECASNISKQSMLIYDKLNIRRIADQWLSLLKE